MADPTILYDLAVDILAVAVDALTDPPARQYVSPGEPPFDCELVAVHWARTIASGQPIPLPSVRQQQKTGVVPVADFVVTVVRCTPTPRAGATPSAAVLQASAEQLGLDAEAIRHALVAMVKAGTVGGSCRAVAFRDVAAATPSGGFVGFTAGIGVMLG